VELRVLRYFLAVADSGSVTAAARVIHVTQPSVSRQIRALERELGTALFTRGPGPLRLSAAGRRFWPIARDLVSRADRAREVMHATGIERMLPLTVLAPPATVTYVLAPFIATHGADLPLLDARQEEPLRVFERLAHEDIDFALSTVAPPGRLRTRLVGHAAIRAQLPRSHPLAGRVVLGLSELLAQPLIVMNRLNLTRIAFDEAVSRIGGTYQAVIEAESPAMAQALAAAGRGVCVLTDGPRFDLSVVRIEGRDGLLSIPLYAGWDAAHYASATIDQVVERMRAYHAARADTPALEG
jgi:DNA-binding transcriptional LysR family regulator